MTTLQAVEAGGWAFLFTAVALVSPAAALGVALYGWSVATKLFFDLMSRPNASSTQQGIAIGIMVLAAFGLGYAARSVGTGLSAGTSVSVAESASLASSRAKISNSPSRVWGPHNGAGPLGPELARTFRSATYVETKLVRDTVFYRVYGGRAGELGSYWTRVRPQGTLQSQMDSAILPEWGNTGSRIATIRVPQGTIVYEGVAAGQTGSSGLPNLLGGGSQVYIPRVDPKWVLSP